MKIEHHKASIANFIDKSDSENEAIKIRGIIISNIKKYSSNSL